MTSVTDCCETVCALVLMSTWQRSAGRWCWDLSTVRASQRAKSSRTEKVTMTEDAVEYVANWSGDAVEDVGGCESHRQSRGKWSRYHCDDWQRGSEIVREPDYLKFLAEAEEAVDPDQYLDMSDEDECGRDQKVCAAPEFSDAVAAGYSGNATCNSVIRSGSQSSNEQLWTESDLENYMKRCKKVWADEEQEELMESLKTLHELKESWKNMIHNEEVMKTRECQCGTCLGSKNLRVRMTTSGSSRTRWETQGSRRFWNKG